MRRVAVTGLGIISPVGNNAADFFSNLMSGRSGVRRITEDFVERLSIRIAAPVDFNPADYFPKKQVWALDRATQMALSAASQAWKDSGLVLTDDEKKLAGTFIGTGMAGAMTLAEVYASVYMKQADRVSPLSVTKIMSNAPASHISILYQLAGPCLTYSTACSASAVAIGEAYRLIKSGGVDIMLAGGAESMITLASMKCWESLGVLALEDPDDPSASCRPFSKDRTGFVLGEGAAIVILEEMERARRRGVKILRGDNRIFLNM